MKLFVDDRRDFPNGDYQCVRETKDAKTLLSIMNFDFVSLDYDLGKDAENGLEILIWMKQNHIEVKTINIHSDHSVSCIEMLNYCRENFPETNVTLNLFPNK